MLEEHLGYLADAVRLRRYRAATARAVRPGARIADLGCGSGVLGLLCLRAGAAHAVFVDETDMIEVAREAVARAGLLERASFIRGRSQHIELPRKVDMVVCDHVGNFGFDYGLVELLQDARRRFLRPRGTLLPARLRLRVAAVTSGKCHALAEAWTARRVPPEFQWLRETARNTKHAVGLKPAELSSRAATLCTIDLRREQSAFFSWNAELRIARDGPVHGLGGWFECELAPRVWMTNSPLARRPIRRAQVFLPLGAAVRAKAGERIEVNIMARPADSLLAWTVEFPATGQRIRHSTFHGMPLSRNNLAAADPARIPALGREGRARLRVLARCDGKRSAREIEQAVLRERPALFPTAAETRRFVARVLGRDAE